MSDIKSLIKYRKNFKQREFILDIFTTCTKTEVDIDENGLGIIKDKDADYYAGKIVANDNINYFVESVSEEGLTLSKINFDLPLSPQDTLVINKEDMSNVSKKVTTSIGNLLINTVLLEDPFEDIFEFINEVRFPINDFEKDIVRKALTNEITVEQMNKYINNLFTIGHFTEPFVPSFTEKSLTVDKKVKQRRDELLEKHKDELDDPVVMSNIESELISLDRETLKDDPSYNYLNPNGKAFDISRKKCLIVGGMMADFEDKEYEFIPKSLDEGWDVSHMDIAMNDIRKGIASRAMETAKGGEETKFLNRVFQDSRIVEDDCGTKRTIKVIPQNDTIDSFLYRYVKTGSKYTLMTDENKSSFIGKEIELPSPMKCQSKNGYCYRCIDQVLKQLETTDLSPSLVAVGSVFLTESMKKMHGVKTKVNDISDLDQFILP